MPELDGSYDDWLRAGPDEELAREAARVQRIFADTLPYIPLLTPNDVWVHGTHVRGWRPFPADLFPSARAYGSTGPPGEAHWTPVCAIAVV